MNFNFMVPDFMSIATIQYEILFKLVHMLFLVKKTNCAIFCNWVVCGQLTTEQKNYKKRKKEETCC